MGRKGGSFKFEKRQKEIKKQKKRREKMERRQNKSEEDEPVPVNPTGMFDPASDPTPEI